MPFLLDTKLYNGSRYVWVEKTEMKDTTALNTIEVTGIPPHLLKLIDEKVRQQGSDRAAYIRQLIERDILGEAPQHPRAALPCLQHPFNASQWEADMKALASGADKIPVLPPEAFTRESIYSNHD
jgi:hypothetical protein